VANYPPVGLIRHQRVAAADGRNSPTEEHEATDDTEGRCAAKTVALILKAPDIISIHPGSLTMTTTSPSRTAIAAAVLAAFALNVSFAQTTDKKPVATMDKAAVSADQNVDFSDRNRMKAWTSNKELLAMNLKVGASKADYMKLIADAGFTITAINADKPDYVEYEVVKGTDSYEVQIDLDQKTKLGSKVDVDRNMRRADSTKTALRSGKAVAATKPLPDGTMYSDRTYAKNWTSEKEKIHKSLAVGKDLTFYQGELKKMGYQITAMNDKEKDYVEMEIVKGRDSYEVQIDLDGTGKGKKIDVTSNMWQADATEKALAAQKKM